MSDDVEVVVYVVSGQRAAEDASLVLTALEIPHTVAAEGPTRRIVVLASDAARARAALDEVARERARPRLEEPSHPPTLAGVHVAVLLALVYLWSGPRAGLGRLFALGVADAQAILRGDWWRTVTALTLHSDGQHLLGNAVFGALFVGALGGAVGTGTALWITLLAGGLGNAGNAWMRAPVHSAVGASTAVFGAVGALSGVAFRRRRRGTRPASAWVTLGAGLALLAMLGSSAETDVGAHAFGFVVGVPLGVVAAALPRLGTAAQVGLSLLALAAVAWVWSTAGA